MWVRFQCTVRSPMVNRPSNLFNYRCSYLFKRNRSSRTSVICFLHRLRLAAPPVCIANQPLLLLLSSTWTVSIVRNNVTAIPPLNTLILPLHLPSRAPSLICTLPTRSHVCSLSPSLSLSSRLYSLTHVVVVVVVSRPTRQ